MVTLHGEKECLMIYFVGYNFLREIFRGNTSNLLKFTARDKNKRVKTCGKKLQILS